MTYRRHQRMKHERTEVTKKSASDLRQSRRHERMNGSKPHGPSGDQQTSVEVAAGRTARSPFPSPRPSPSGRGRILRWPSAKPSAVSARPTSRTSEANASCSLSPPPSRRSGALARREGGWERVRVRGSGTACHPVVRTVPGTVKLGDSSGGAGGFPERL